MADEKLPEPVTLEWPAGQVLDFQAEMRAHAKKVSGSLRLDIVAEQKRAENDMVMALFSKMRRISPGLRQSGFDVDEEKTPDRQRRRLWVIRYTEEAAFPPSSTLA